MPRPRRSVPFLIRDLNFNPKSGYYEITERSVLYQMTLEMTRSLKEHFRVSTATLEEWYSSLSREERKSVVRSGSIKNNDTGFHPDVSYDE